MEEDGATRESKKMDGGLLRAEMKDGVLKTKIRSTKQSKVNLVPVPNTINPADTDMKRPKPTMNSSWCQPDIHHSSVSHSCAVFKNY